MGTSDRIKRGDIGKDVRTGQIVKVTEIGRGNDVLVKTVYKSDGYWTGKESLIPADDPHVWGIKQLLIMLLALAAGAFTAYGSFKGLTDSGVSGGDAFWHALLSGMATTWVVSLITGIFRK